MSAEKPSWPFPLVVAGGDAKGRTGDRGRIVRPVWSRKSPPRPQKHRLAREGSPVVPAPASATSAAGTAKAKAVRS